MGTQIEPHVLKLLFFQKCGWMIWLGLFSLIALSSAVLRPCRARQRSLFMRGQNGGIVGQALVIHGREGMVLNTFEEVFLSGFILLEDQGGHPPDHTGALSGTEHYLTCWDFSTFKIFCLISSLGAWQNHGEDWTVAKFILYVIMKMTEQIMFHSLTHLPTLTSLLHDQNNCSFFLATVQLPASVVSAGARREGNSQLLLSVNFRCGIRFPTQGSVHIPAPS